MWYPEKEKTMGLQKALVTRVADVPKDFTPQYCYKDKGTNGQEHLVWVVTGTGNWQKHKGGAEWSQLGYEFDTEKEARKFYAEHSKEKLPYIDKDDNIYI